MVFFLKGDSFFLKRVGAPAEARPPLDGRPCAPQSDDLLCIGICIDMHIDMRRDAYRHMYGHVCRQTHRHMYGDAYSRTDTCMAMLIAAQTHVWRCVIAAQTHVQSDPGFKNLGSGCKSLELCADVVSDVGTKAKSRHLGFLQPDSYTWGLTVWRCVVDVCILVIGARQRATPSVRSAAPTSDQYPPHICTRVG